MWRARLPTAGRAMDGTEATIMNVQLVGPAALIAALAGPAGGRGGDRAGMLWRGLRARIVEEVLYRRSLRELRRLDNRTLDDIDVARVDFPGLARRHAREAATAAR